MAQIDNRVIVKSIDDFPAPVGGVITLEENTVYTGVDERVDIFIPYQLKFQLNSNIQGVFFTTNQSITTDGVGGDIKIDDGQITYIGTGNLFDVPNAGFVNRLWRMNILCPYGTLFNMNTSLANSFFIIDECVVFVAASLGKISDLTCVIKSCQFFNFAVGLTLENIAGLQIETLQTNAIAPTTTLSFTGIYQGQLTITGYSPILTQSNEYAFYFDPTTTYLGGVAVTTSPVQLVGSATQNNIFQSGSLNQTTIGFKFIGNTFIPDSTVFGNLFFQDNTTQTVIDSAQVPIKINGTYQIGDNERFTTTNGTLIYSGVENTKRKVIANIGFRPVVGINILLGGYVAKTEAETYEVTFDNTTNTVNRTSHGLSNGTSIRFSTTNTLPSGIRDDQFYWVVNATANTFQVENLPGSGVHPFTNNGTGTHYYSLGEYIESSEANATPSFNRLFSVATLSAISLTTGDKIEVFVYNYDTTSDIIVETLQLIVD